MKIRKRTVGLLIYFFLLMLPIYWMLNMSLRTNADIMEAFALYMEKLLECPHRFGGCVEGDHPLDLHLDVVIPGCFKERTDVVDHRIESAASADLGIDLGVDGVDAEPNAAQ